MFSQEVKDTYPLFRFDELEKFMSSYEHRYYAGEIPKTKKPSELLGHKGVFLLLHILQRSRAIFTGFEDCVNLTHVVLAYLAARAHFETTGSIAYLLWNLRQFYMGEINQTEIEDIFLRLMLGSRTSDVKDSIPERTEAINVLTQIKTADELFKEMGGKEEGIFRNCYDFLSEYCHPNMLGLTVGSEVAEEYHTVFYEKPKFKDEHFGILINYMLISCRFFFLLYDKSFVLLKDHELMPDLLRSNE